MAAPESRLESDDRPPRRSWLERAMQALRSKQADAAALLFLSLVVLLFMGRVVFLGKVLLPLDTVYVMEPWSSETAGLSEPPWNPIITDAVWQSFPLASVARELRRGGSYFWNPYSMAGMPSMAAGEWFVHPVLFGLSNFTSVGTAMSWTAVFALWVAGTFTYLLLRELDCGTWASLIGSLAFTFNGYLVNWLCLPNMTGCMVWLPVIAWGIERSLRLRDWRWGLPGAVAFAMQIFSGNILWPLYGSVTVGLLLSARALIEVWRTGTLRAARHPLLYGALPFVIGAGLAATSLFLTLQLFFHTGRTSQLGARTALDGTMHAWRLLVPALYGDALHGTGYRSAFNFAETNLYFGILPLFFMLAALAAPRRRLTWPLFGLGMSALLAVYNVQPFRQLIAWIYLVFLNTFPGRIFYVVAFCGALLAGLGADWLVKCAPRRTLRILAALALALAVVLLSFAGGAAYPDSFLAHLVSASFLPPTRLFSVENVLVAAGFLIAAAAIFWLWGWLNKPPAYLLGMAVLCVTADLFVAGVNFNPAFDEALAFPETPSLRVLRNLQADKFGTVRIATVPSYRILYGMSPQVYGLQSVSGYTPWALNRYGMYVHLMQPVTTINHVFLNECCPPLLNAVNAKYIYTPAGVALKNSEALDLIYDGSVKIYDNRAALPRAWVVHRVTAAPPGRLSDVMQRLGAPDFDPAREAVVEAEREVPARDAASVPPPRAEIVRYEPERVVIEAALSQDGLLVLSDAMYPGWTVRVDERPAPIYYTNLFMRGVALGAGTHRVEFVYSSRMFTLGLAVSIATVVLMIGTAVLRP